MMGIRFLLGNLAAALLILTVLVIKRAGRRQLSAAGQYRLWQVTAAAVLILLLPVGLPLEKASGRAMEEMEEVVFVQVESAGQTVAAQNEQLALAAQAKTEKQPWLLWIWLCGAAVVGGACSGALLRLNSRLRCAQEAPLEVQQLFDQCREKAGVTKRARLCVSSAVSGPLTTGILRPRIVLPESVVQSASREELEAILFHEGIHLRHGDQWWGPLWALLQGLCWFNPLLWLAGRQMKREGELYCDYAVLCLLEEGQRLGYGYTLLRFAAGRQKGGAVMNSLSGAGGRLEERLRQVAHFRPASQAQHWLTGIAAVCVALLAVLQLPLLNAYANDSAVYRPAEPIQIQEADYSAYFGDNKGCVLLCGEQAGGYMVYNWPLCQKRVSPASTVKPYIALNALDQGLITLEDSWRPWDGTRYAAMDNWMKDQNLYSAMASSCNWYFQDLDEAAGVSELTQFYQRIGYGNAEVGQDVRNYWREETLKISPLEQIELLRELHGEAWGFAPEAVETVRQGLLLEETEQGRLYGKTGTCIIDQKEIGDRMIMHTSSWFIGWVDTVKGTYYFVANAQGRSTAGSEAKAAIMRILAEQGIYSSSGVSLP